MTAILPFVQNVLRSSDKEHALNKLEKDEIEAHKTRILQGLKPQGFTDFYNSPIPDKIRKSKDKHIRQLFWEWGVLYHLGEYRANYLPQPKIISIFQDLKISYDNL